MSIGTIIGIVFGVIFGLVAVVLILAYLLLPYFFKKYAKRYDGSYDPDLDPLKKKALSMNVKKNVDGEVLGEIKALKPLSDEGPGVLKFDTKEQVWRIEHDSIGVLDNIGASLILNDQKYSTSPYIWGGEKIPLQKTEKKEIDTPLGEAIDYRGYWNIPSLDLSFTTHIIVIESSEKPCIIFKIRLKEFPEEITLSSENHHDRLNFVFPAFENYKALQRTLSYKDTVFCPAQRDFKYTHGPVAFFNDNRDVLLVSALDQFLVSPWSKKDAHGTQQIQFGIHSSIKQIPDDDFSHQSIMVLGSGIRKTFQLWADCLREYHNLPQKPLRPDLPTSNLGYFTDNGAAYYYNTEKGMKADETLIEVKKHADELDIPYSFYHLDSWWYQKTTSETKQKWLGWLGSILGGALYGGALLWEPDPNYIDMPLSALSKRLNAPFTAHNRWFEPGSPYRERFNFIEEKGGIMPDDNDFWDHIMRYCKEHNITVYEQDWMSNQIRRFSHFQNTLTKAEEWLTQMAENAEKYGITVQYCMETPAMVMQSIFYPAVTHCRTSDDYHGYTFKTYDVPGFTQASLLAHVLGLRPFKDVFKTTKVPYFKYRGERMPEIECLLASLSTGPVAPGDQIGNMDADLIMKSCRKDGELLMPNFPLTAIDLMYIQNQTYYISSAESHVQCGDESLKWFYVLTMNLFPKRVKERAYKAKEFGLPEGIQYIEYDWHENKTRLVSGNSLISQNLKFEQYKYRVYVPYLSDWLSIIGEPSKFTTFSDVRFNLVEYGERKAQIEIDIVEGEEMLIFFVVKNDDALHLEFQLNGQNIHVGQASNLPSVDVSIKQGLGGESTDRKRFQVKILCKTQSSPLLLEVSRNMA